MADVREQHRCAHPGCDCIVPEDDEYCSPHCDTAPEAEVTCGCGHAACLTGKVGSATA
ncbi:MAG TPA: hypothetical protein VFD58_28205 [Blastocatellia bacterium]|nr:hypothetical protein [Blastocatellia bacterium]